MGSSGSKVVKKILTSVSKDPSTRRESELPSYFDEADGRTHSLVARVPPQLGPIVLQRQGSRFFDEDGDLAHEFYTEVKEGKKSRMKRVYENLRPEGTVKLPFPRLHNDCPVIIYVL